ncbi:MAG: DNA polymerase III subunit alpha [Holosporaceae bacterium]|jgi:DNA polymerase-3 subunit alpha|nr:DNA polymerase III subunit alpha [Holosporaceae bacterium]
MNDNRFVHLRLHSAYSLAEGAIKMEKLVALCRRNQMPAVAVTDTNNLFGAMEFSAVCMENGIQPIIGCQLNVQHAIAPSAAVAKQNHPTNILLYAKNSEGYHNLIQLVSQAHLNSSSEFYPEVTLDLLAKHSQDLIALTGGIYGSLGSFLASNDLEGAREYLKFMHGHFPDRLYVELSRHNNELENKTEEQAISLAYAHKIPLVATNNVCFSSPEDFTSHDVLICIAQGKTIYDADRVSSSREFYFKSSLEMNELFRDIPEALENTIYVAQRCCFALTKKKTMMPQFQPASGKTQDEELLFISNAGLEKKLIAFQAMENYQDFREKYFARLHYELEMIKKMGFSGYFLIIADYVQWAKLQDIPVGPGRGSGAGSIVAWSVGITDVDPIYFGLFFERFLNPDRVSMPDFDIDFCQERRDEVIRYVQQKYGYQSVAQIITFGKLQAKAVVKDVGRVLAMPYGFMDKISKMIPFHPTNPMTLPQAIDSEELLRNLINSDPQVKKLMEIAICLEGLYRHASVHAAGVVISDKNLQDIVPLYKDQRSIMPVTQFSMKYVENTGLIKFDFLGLKTLTVIDKTLKNMRKRGIDLRANDFPLDDKKTFELLRIVNCIGVFQIESAGMRDVLRKMQPDRVEDLIALVALYRPGPMDDIPKYIACKHGTESIQYIDPRLKPILAPTYGVMVYQEQVMRIAQEIGGYSLGQADILRRAMGKKDKNEMLAQKKRFVDGAVQNGMVLLTAEHLFEQMNKVAGYGFNKSHATPYGLLTYQTAFLKANYPIEFFAASMTIDVTNSDKLHVYYQDAKKNNIHILPPDINLSGHEFLIDYDDNSIRYSLTAIKGSGEQVVLAVLKEREQNGDFLSIFDFVKRLSHLRVFTRRILEHFIKAGAFDRLHSNRRQLFESIDQLIGMKADSDQALLFEQCDPPLVNVPEWNDTDKLQQEFSAIGFYISSHPMQQYANVLREMRFPSLQEAKELARAKIVVIINNVLYKTTKNQHKFCILQVSDVSGMADVSLFSEALSNYRPLLEVGNMVLLDISCSKTEDQVRITADKVQKFSDNFQSVVKDVRTTETVTSMAGERTLQIRISSRNELNEVKKLMDNFRMGTNFRIILLVQNGRKVLLPSAYFLTSYDILDLRRIVGVENVIE